MSRGAMEGESAREKPTADPAKAAEPREAPPKPAADKPAPDKPAANEPAKDKPAADKPAPDKPAANEPAKDKPAQDEPARNEPPEDDAGMPPMSDGAIDDPKVAIKAVRTEGELCPADSAAASVSSDGAAATIVFSVAKVEAGAEGGCKVELDLDLAPGYQFNWLRLHSSGYVFAEQAGTNLEVSASFRGSSEQQRFVHDELSGDDSFLFSDRFDALWSPCDSKQSATLAFDLVAQAAPEGYLSLTALDLDFAAADGISWRRCDKP